MATAERLTERKNIALSVIKRTRTILLLREGGVRYWGTGEERKTPPRGRPPGASGPSKENRG